MKTTIIGKPVTTSKEKIGILCKDAYMSLTGKLDIDNKIIIKKLLTEYCILLGKKEIEITSTEIVQLITLHYPILDNKEVKKITTEISRRISGAESHELSGHFVSIMKNGKQVRRNGSYLRLFTPDSDAFIAKNTLDI